jgi:hypothetical protein
VEKCRSSAPEYGVFKGVEFFPAFPEFEEGVEEREEREDSCCAARVDGKIGYHVVRIVRRLIGTGLFEFHVAVEKLTPAVSGKRFFAEHDK